MWYVEGVVLFVVGLFLIWFVKKIGLKLKHYSESIRGEIGTTVYLGCMFAVLLEVCE